MPGRVLIVDDNPVNLRVLEAKLTAEYYDVVTAEDGPRAIAAAIERAPDMILLDVMMPGMNGFEVCRRLKQDPRTSHVPVVMVTALSDQSDRVRGLDAGADDFLTKPVHDVSLFARVRSLIRLKMLIDVWRAREATSSRLGLGEEPSLANETTAGALILRAFGQMGDVEIDGPLAAEGHRIEPIGNATRILDLTTSRDADLLVVAMERAPSEAFRLCGQIRSATQDAVRVLPILLIADAGTERGIVNQALDLGVNDFLVRPIDPAELTARVRTQVRRRRFERRLRRLFEESIALSATDGLTGLYNRRYLEIHLTHLARQAHQEGKPLSIAFADIDRFKAVNDGHGHAAGDAVLVEVARRISRNLRNFDITARYGGEEFVVVMPDTAKERALRIAERLRRNVAKAPVVHEGKEIPVTISIGIADLWPNESTAGNAMKRADMAMFEAKQTGRNRVVVAGLT
jgi:two-component system cell cycle response regulator